MPIATAPLTYARGQRVTLTVHLSTQPRRLAREAAPGSAQLLLVAPPPATWQPGDSLILSPHDPAITEIVTIASIAGRTVTLTAALTSAHPLDPAGAGRDLVSKLANGTGVTISVLTPGATVPDIYSGLANPSIGVYTMDLTLDESGSWAWRAASTVGVIAAGWRRILVEDDPFD